MIVPLGHRDQRPSHTIVAVVVGRVRTVALLRGLCSTGSTIALIASAMLRLRAIVALVIGARKWSRVRGASVAPQLTWQNPCPAASHAPWHAHT
jgi:hypothetical protein